MWPWLLLVAAAIVLHMTILVQLGITALQGSGRERVILKNVNQSRFQSGKRPEAGTWALAVANRARSNKDFAHMEIRGIDKNELVLKYRFKSRVKKL
jgi:hypothetical protein